LELFYALHPGKATGIRDIRSRFRGKTGLEIGGPSRRFTWKGIVPLYNVVERVDGCNFSGSTIWEGTISSNEPYRYKSRTLGTQYIADATELSSISDDSYDFILSSHSLEHIANPIKAITEWLRVLKDGGLILLILPNKEFCFDHKRPVTTFAHILEDFRNDVGEDDMTHLPEVLELHDLEMDTPLESREMLKERAEKNFGNRAMHHHVFDFALLRQLFDYFDLKELYSNLGEDHIILGQKL